MSRSKSELKRIAAQVSLNESAIISRQALVQWLYCILKGHDTALGVEDICLQIGPDFDNQLREVTKALINERNRGGLNAEGSAKV